MMIRYGRHKKIVAAIRKQVPETTGVYIFYGGGGIVVYIGKSVRLRSRMLSYFRLRRGREHPRLGRLVHGIRRFEYRTVDTELQALLLEDELIKSSPPVYNVRQNQYRKYRYLILLEDNGPRLEAVSKPEPDKGESFGPFRDKYFVADLSYFITDNVFRAVIREAASRGIHTYLHLGGNLGPPEARHWAPKEIYDGCMAAASAFLNGRDERVVEDLQLRMTEAAENKNYEEAAFLRDQLEFCRRFCSRQRFIHRFASQKLTVVDAEHPDTPHVFIRGDYDFTQLSHVTTTPSDDARFTLDRANIVYNWINKNGHRCEYLFEPV